MRFSLLKLSASKQHNGDYHYVSKAMELGGSPAFTSTFHSANEMISLMNEILALQKKSYAHVGSMVERIRNEGIYFFDVELTKRQAELLGWRPQQGEVSSPRETKQLQD
jgi:hypothetical protein